MSLLRNISPRLLRIWQRNFDVSLVTWKTNVLPPLLEPLIYIFAFGFGLGAYVEYLTNVRSTREGRKRGEMTRKELKEELENIEKGIEKEVEDIKKK